MLCFSHILRLHTSAILVYIAHIEFGNLHEFTALCQDLEHLFHMIFLALLCNSISIATHVHLCTNTVNLRHTVSFPLFNPMYQTLNLLIVIPVRLQIIVVDKEFQRINTTILGIILTGSSHNNAHIVFVTQVVLPVEVILSIFCRDIFGRLQSIESFTVITTSRNSFVHYIPSGHITASSFHHTFYPVVHGPCKGIFLLFGSQFKACLVRRISLTFSR